MATLSDIASTNWCVSTRGSGYVEQGLEEVRQCIDVLLRTQKGTDPLRPDFGSDIYQQIDQPINLAIPNVKKAIISAIGMYEQRVEVLSIAHAIDISDIQFYITYKLIDNDLIDQLQLFMNGNGFVVMPSTPGAIIIETDIPTNGTYQLLIDFIIDGKAATPISPAFGFANTSILFAWIQANWAQYGNWYLTPGKLVGYLNTGITTASLNISLSTLYRYSSPILNLTAGQSYGLAFSEDISVELASANGVSPLMEGLLNYAIDNYSHAGSWVIESYDGTGDFDVVDFDAFDFNTRLYYQLVLYSTTLPNAQIVVITL